MRTNSTTRPHWFLITVLVLTLGLGLIGRPWEFLASGSTPPALTEPDARLTLEMRGPLLHTLLQSVGATLALVTAICAFSHFSLLRNQTTAVVGAALLFAGLIDVLHIVVLDQFVSRVVDQQQFGPFTWALSRIFHAGIVALGTGPFAWGTPAHGSWTGGKRWLLVPGCAVMGIGTFAIIQVCAHVENLPEALKPAAVIPRPWDGAALILYLLAGGILLPRFYRRHPSLFSFGLLLSLLPHMLGEALVAFGSRSMYDAPFLTGQLLKLLGYAVPLAGLLIDYTRVYRAEGELRSTREKLAMAREIQQGLLPDGAPQCRDYQIEGLCIPTDAVGGDFFDYVPMADGHLGIVIADVSGHDLGAAILMSQARAYLRAEARYTRSPGQLLAKMNLFLCRDVRDRRFISVFIAVLHPTQPTFTYAGAGHNGYLIGSQKLLRELEPTGPVLGVVEMEYEECADIPLAPGESLVLLTDGWPEATSHTGEAFGMSRVIDSIANAHTSPRNTLATLHERVLTFRKQLPADDDLTAVIVKRPEAQESQHEPAVAG